MLQVSDTAAMAFRAFLDTESEANAIRLELTRMPEDESVTAIRFAAVDAPSEGDVQASASDVEVFVAPELNEPLSNAVIDTQMTPDGAELVIRRREDATASSAENRDNGQRRGEI
jgi:Fe-S cluster assembly iron-binding protein IscA